MGMGSGRSLFLSGGDTIGAVIGTGSIGRAGMLSFRSSKFLSAGLDNLSTSRLHNCTSSRNFRSIFCCNVSGRNSACLGGNSTVSQFLMPFDFDT